MGTKIVLELEKLREFLHGAHLATNDDNAGGVLHQACHKVDDIIRALSDNHRMNMDVLFGSINSKEADNNVGGK